MNTKTTRTAARVEPIVIRLREACADPDGPLYHSDLVPLIGNLIEECLQICAERDACAIAMDQEHERALRAEMPKCAKCGGTGSEHRSWNNDYIDCHSCNGRGF